MHDDSLEAVENRRPDSHHGPAGLDSNGSWLSLQGSFPTGIRQPSTDPSALLTVGLAPHNPASLSPSVATSAFRVITNHPTIRPTPTLKQYGIFTFAI